MHKTSREITAAKQFLALKIAYFLFNTHAVVCRESL